MEPLRDKTIILAVSGGIACYKSVELMRLFQRAKADVRVTMTRNAARFAGPLTFEAISGNPVFLDMFAPAADDAMRHVSWAEQADAAVIAPATGNIIGKLANGIADDALTTLMLGVTAPRIICPAMNTHMYENRAVQRNLDLLEKDGYIIAEPGAGDLACGAVGPGRLADPERIFEIVYDLFLPSDYFGMKVVVTAGPTREHLDPVRFISNPSSGRMGYAVARAAAARGADVILVSGPTDLPAPSGVHRVQVTTAGQMAEAVFAEADDADVIIKAAAVSDYRPAKTEAHKVKKAEDKNPVLELEKTTDILSELGRRKKKNQVLAGFAAETRDLENYAAAKLESKNLDLIAANLVGGKDSGFESSTNRIRLFYRNKNSEELPLMDKEEAAHILLDRIAGLYG